LSQKSEKKVVVVKTLTDTNGKITEEVQKVTGVGADKLIKELEGKGQLKPGDISKQGNHEVKIVKKSTTEHTTDPVNEIEIDEKLEVLKTINADGTIRSLYILTTLKGDEVTTEKWDGTGEPPANIKRVLSGAEVNTIIIDEENEVEDVWVTKNGKEHKLDEGHEIIFIKEDISGNPINRVSLGIKIGSEGEGVTVAEVVEGSGAALAGIMAGDIVTKVNGTSVTTTQSLLKLLNPYIGGETIEVTYLRDGKELTTKATLKAR